MPYGQVATNINGNALTNEMRQMRLENMMARYGGSSNSQIDPNATYQDISGMTPEDSQKIGQMAASLGSSANNQYMVPTNQPAQVLLNNKSLMGGATEFASGLAQSLKNPPPAKTGKNGLPPGELPKNLETTLAAYQNNDTTKAASRVQQMYGQASNLYNKANPSASDDTNLALLGAKMASPMSRMTDLPVDPQTALSFLTSLGLSGAQAQEIQESKKAMTPEMRKRVMDSMTALSQGIEGTANTARGAFTHYMTLNGVQNEDIDKMFPSFSVTPVATEVPFMVHNAVSKGADPVKAQDALIVMQDPNADPTQKKGAQNYLKMYQ